MSINDVVLFLTSDQLNDYLLPFKILAVLVSLVFMYGAYRYNKMQELNIGEWKRKYAHFFHETSPEETKDFAQRFQDIVGLINKKNQLDTKMAILKSQNLLDDILKKMDLTGDILGELSDDKFPNAPAMKVLIDSADKVRRDPAYLVNIEKTKELFIAMRDTLLKIGII